MLKFASFSSSADTAFWHTLSQRKLTEYRLSRDAQPMFASYASGYRPDMPPRVAVSAESFESEPATARVGQVYLMRGDLYNTNTLDEFKTADVAAFAQTTAAKIAHAIVDGTALEDNTQLHRFMLLTFADLKKYKFYYWFAFPAIVPSGDAVPDVARAPITDTMDEGQMVDLAGKVEAMRMAVPTLSTFIVDSRGGDMEVLPITALAPDMFEQQGVLFAVVDPCGMPEHPGWPLRNFLALLSHHGGAGMHVRVLCYRHHTMAGTTDVSRSLIVDTVLPVYDLSEPQSCKHVKGVEKNSKGRLAPRLCDLAGSMDPTRLAETAVDLNLKLMRWRLLPSVDLERIAGTRCLLLGAGTLGCNVARALLGWGVRHITFVDNGRVSYSNPVRQSLFQFEDCRDGGKPKADTAAMRLRQIFPGVTTKGITMTIPMAGHPVAPEAFDQSMECARELERLISEHDAVLLLTDTREARWLPTVIAAAQGKLCMTAALGFDTYVAMRHGVLTSDGTKMTAGCYFCNDGTAPQDSTKDRTLDQQCTVSRPGVSMVAGATVVELLVSLLHHKDGPAAGLEDPSDDEASPMGAVPQQVRGSVSGFSSMLFAGHPFANCIACSPKVLELWRNDPERLVREAVNKPQFLEDLTGITEMKAVVDELEDIDIDIDLNDDEE